VKFHVPAPILHNRVNNPVNLRVTILRFAMSLLQDLVERVLIVTAWNKQPKPIRTVQRIVMTDLMSEQALRRLDSVRIVPQHKMTVHFSEMIAQLRNFAKIVRLLARLKIAKIIMSHKRLLAESAMWNLF
jgi:hypothetical protein